MTMKLTTNDKRKIYEQVMTAVTKQLDGVLNEGTWGPEPLQNDYVLDILDPLIKKNMDGFQKEIERLYDGTAEESWKAIGLCEFLIDIHISMNIIFFFNDEKFPILSYYEKAIHNVEKDEKWINEWKDPEEIKRSIYDRYRKLHRYMHEFENWDKKK